MDYVSFAFGLGSSDETRPHPRSYYSGAPETDLNETFEREVPSDVLDKAQSDGEISFDLFEDLRYIDVGDKLALSSGDRRESFLVSDVVRVRTNDTGEKDSFALKISLSPAD